jgi:hypothetical protein
MKRVGLPFVKSGVDFTNILLAALMGSDTKSTKNTVKLLVFFALLGSLHAKVECKILVKLTQGAFIVRDDYKK